LNNQGINHSALPVRFFLFAAASRPVLGPTQPPIQCLPETLSPGVKRPGRELTIYLRVVPRLRMRGAVPPLLQ